MCKILTLLDRDWVQAASATVVGGTLSWKPCDTYATKSVRGGHVGNSSNGFYYYISHAQSWTRTNCDASQPTISAPILVVYPGKIEGVVNWSANGGELTSTLSLFKGFVGSEEIVYKHKQEVCMVSARLDIVCIHNAFGGGCEVDGGCDSEIPVR